VLQAQINKNLADYGIEKRLINDWGVFVLQLYLRICTFEYACNLVTPFGMAATFSRSVHTDASVECTG
jgi:hypothetical protein